MMINVSFFAFACIGNETPNEVYFAAIEYGQTSQYQELQKVA
jgi:hypothetical protein